MQFDAPIGEQVSGLTCHYASDLPRESLSGLMRILTWTLSAEVWVRDGSEVGLGIPLVQTLGNLITRIRLAVFIAVVTWSIRPEN